MTTYERAKKLNDLLKRAVEIKAEAKRVNGKDCFNMKSLDILGKLQYQIEQSFKELAETI